MRLDLYKLLGVPYFTDSLIAAVNNYRQEKAYRIYVTDCFYSITYSLGNPMNKRYYDILHNTPEDDRDGEEIAYERLERFGVKVVE